MLSVILRYLRDFGVAYIAGGAVAFLVAASILRATGWQWIGISARTTEVRDAGEVKNYVEFSIVSIPPFQVVTGIRYDSSLNGWITEQWCYLEHAKKASGEAEVKLTLAEVEGMDAPIPNSFSTDNLKHFGLTADTVLILIKAHCRFKTAEKSSHA